MQRPSTSETSKTSETSASFSLPLFINPCSMDIGSKKNLLFAMYLLFNALVMFLLLGLENGYLYVSVFVVGGHVRDVINILFQVAFMSRVLSHPTPPEEQTMSMIYCLVPVFNEEFELVKKNLDSLVGQELPAIAKVAILIVFDGVDSRNQTLYDQVDSLITYPIGDAYRPKEEAYEVWKSKRSSKANYREGTYRGVQTVVCHKLVNAGKKDTLIMGESIIARMYGGGKIDCFIYHTDGDTIADKKCLGHLLASLKSDKELDGVSSLLRAYRRPGLNILQGGFVSMQDYQYFYSLIVRRQTESLLDSTTCLPGCSNMIRYNPKSQTAIDKYRNLPVLKDGLLQAVTRMQGTDRRYTTLLLKQGAKLRMNWRAVVYTDPPRNTSSFISQRRRWSSNAFFNSIVLLYTPGITMYIKISALVDVLKLFCTLFRFLSYFAFWFFLPEFSLRNIVTTLVFLVFPYVYSFCWVFSITDTWASMIWGFILNKICMPFLSVVSVSKMYFTATNFKWSSVGPRVMSPPTPFASGYESET